MPRHLGSLLTSRLAGRARSTPCPGSLSPHENLWKPLFGSPTNLHGVRGRPQLPPFVCQLHWEALLLKHQHPVRCVRKHSIPTRGMGPRDQVPRLPHQRISQNACVLFTASKSRRRSLGGNLGLHTVLPLGNSDSSPVQMRLIAAISQGCCVDRDHCGKHLSGPQPSMCWVKCSVQLKRDHLRHTTQSGCTLSGVCS